jgi:GntR family transcriptional regulator/MocR family aminotransferase
MRLYYVRQRKKVIDIIRKSKLGSRCEIIENDSGLHFILKINTKMSEKLLGEKLKSQGILLQPLSEYYYGNEKIREHLYIINYSNIDIEMLPEACNSIFESLDCDE